MRARNSGTFAASIVRPGRLLVAAEPQEEIGAALERVEHVERRNAAAGSVRDVAVDRQDDRRLVVRVDELRRGDADDAAMPAFAADDQHVVRADRRIGLDRLLRLGDEIRFFGLALEVLFVQLLRQPARFLAGRLVGGQQQPRGDVGRAHAPGGVDARREDEPDVVAVDGLAGEAGRFEQRAQADGVAPLLSDSSPSFAITRFSPTSGTTSASVPMAAILTNAGSHFVLSARWQSAWTSFSATPTPARFLSG